MSNGLGVSRVEIGHDVGPTPESTRRQTPADYFTPTLQKPEVFRVKASEGEVVVLYFEPSATQNLKSSGFPRCFKGKQHGNIDPILRIHKWRYRGTIHFTGILIVNTGYYINLAMLFMQLWGVPRLVRSGITPADFCKPPVLSSRVIISSKINRIGWLRSPNCNNGSYPYLECGCKGVRHAGTGWRRLPQRPFP